MILFVGIPDSQTLADRLSGVGGEHCAAFSCQTLEDAFSLICAVRFQVVFVDGRLTDRLPSFIRSVEKHNPTHVVVLHDDPSRAGFATLPSGMTVEDRDSHLSDVSLKRILTQRAPVPPRPRKQAAGAVCIA